MSKKHNCIFCDNIIDTPKSNPHTLDYSIDCPQCGKYKMGRSMFDDFKDNIHSAVDQYLGINLPYFLERKHIISYCIRKEYENDFTRANINTEFIQAALNTKELTFKEQLYSIMLALDKDSTYRGSALTVDKSMLAKYTALSQCKTIKELKNYLKYISSDPYNYIAYEQRKKTNQIIDDKGRMIITNEYKAILRIMGKGLEFLENNSKSLKHTSYDEALDMLHRLKDNIENKDCYRILYEGCDDGADEKVIGYLFKFMPHYSEFNINPIEFDINSEVNNGRGFCDFKISYGKNDATIVEFKLARNFKDNIEEQVEIYKKASNAQKGISAIVCYTDAEIKKAKKFVKDKYNVEEVEHIIIIDATKKKSASIAKAS